MFFIILYRFLFDCANLTLKTVLVLVYLYIIVYFFDKSVKISFFLLEGDALSSRWRGEYLLFV